MEIRLEDIEKVMELAGVDYYTAKEALVKAVSSMQVRPAFVSSLLGKQKEPAIADSFKWENVNYVYAKVL